MALFIFANLNKHGNVRKRLVYSPTTQFTYSPKGLGKLVCVQSFKYTYKHSLIPPGLMVNAEGKKFITPTWQEVHPETTLNDINWVKPKIVEREIPKNTWEFQSSSGGGTYIVKQVGVNKFQCNCPGFYRTKNHEKGCKHVQQIRKELGL